MATPYTGQIISVGFTFTPLGWLPCDGTTRPISEFQPLYTLLGTTYGGDGITSFGLPNLNGRVPLGTGQGQGLSSYVQGQQLGAESVTLTAANTPPHTHNLSFSAANATDPSPKVTGKSMTPGTNVAKEVPGFYYNVVGTIPLLKGSVTPTQGGQPHENRQPFLVLNYIICSNGVFPSRP